jgi:hypothetical protein
MRYCHGAILNSMQNSKTLTIIIGLLVITGFTLYYFETTLKPEATAPTATSSAIMYRNDDFGFVFALPDSWRGYSVVYETWEGNSLLAPSTTQTGTKILLRHPKWTESLPYEDIPVLVFTAAQWNLYLAEGFTISAAPIPATELGRNSQYVFALPPRWNFDYREEYEEAEEIVQSNPLTGFEIPTASAGD